MTVVNCFTPNAKLMCEIPNRCDEFGGITCRRLFVIAERLDRAEIPRSDHRSMLQWSCHAQDGTDLSFICSGTSRIYTISSVVAPSLLPPPPRL